MQATNNKKQNKIKTASGAATHMKSSRSRCVFGFDFSAFISILFLKAVNSCQNDDMWRNCMYLSTHFVNLLGEIQRKWNFTYRLINLTKTSRPRRINTVKKSKFNHKYIADAEICVQKERGPTYSRSFHVLNCTESRIHQIHTHSFIQQVHLKALKRTDFFVIEPCIIYPLSHAFSSSSSFFPK